MIDSQERNLRSVWSSYVSAYRFSSHSWVTANLEDREEASGVTDEAHEALYQRFPTSAFFVRLVT